MKKNTYSLILGVILALFLCACAATNEPELIEPTDEEKMEQLLNLIETKVSEYDGCTVSHEAGTINVDVWKESITGTANSVLAQGGGQQDESWGKTKADVENAVIHIADCIRTSDFASTKLLLNVLDHSDHGRKLLTFNNSGVAYDIVAEAPVASPEEPAADTETASPSKPSAPTNQSQGNAASTNNITYILNTDSMVFHTPSCHVAKRILQENRRDYNGTRDDVVTMGYSACGVCNP